jgi:hypothetical protein
MSEIEPAPRRLSRRERRMLRRFQRRVQLALVGVALLLSAGVVEVMEVPRRPPEEPGRAPSSRPVPAPPSAPPLLVPVARPDLPSTLSTSILDDELVAPREAKRARAASPARAVPDDSTPPAGPASAAEPPGVRTDMPVPQPGTGVLLGLGLAWIAATGRRSASGGGDDRATRRWRSARRRT